MQANRTENWPNWISVWDEVHWVGQKSCFKKIEKSEDFFFQVEKKNYHKKYFFRKYAQIDQE